ncbi:hypothetical protein VdG1_00699 [Verticillium dahliae VDG1]|nr:hypothetical protein VdG1_00699 [Verticillium dahliae VDG1]
MAIDLVFHFLREGPPTWVRDNIWLIVKTAATLFALFLVKLWSNGASNTSELKMHGRVVMVTGGTSGIGAATVLDLAKRGAQVVLLTHAPVSDPFLVEYINDVREQTKNHMVYAEQVDLSSLHSIRQFATKWIDNAPPRRLDMILLCAATFTPAGQPRQVTDEGIEQTWMSPEQGAQSILHAVMEAGMRRGPGGKLIKECREVDFARKDVHDEAAAKQLWEESDKLIEKAEKDAAIVRARNKKQAEDKGKREEEMEKEIEELVNSIKKGKEAQKAKKAKSGAEEKPKGKKKSKKADS